MKRFIAITTMLLFTWTSFAYAHEEINPQSFSTGKPTFFTLSAANEEKQNLVKVTIAAPEGLPFGSTTKEPPGWTVNRTDQTITWDKGSVSPDHFEQWGFEIEGADQPGALTYKVSLGLADGTTKDVDVVVNATSPANPGASGSQSAAAIRQIKADVKTVRGNASTSLIIAIVALVLAIMGFAMASRLRSKSKEMKGSPAGRSGNENW